MLGWSRQHIATESRHLSAPRKRWAHTCHHARGLHTQLQPVGRVWIHGLAPSWRRTTLAVSRWYAYMKVVTRTRQTRVQRQKFLTQTSSQEVMSIKDFFRKLDSFLTKWAKSIYTKNLKTNITFLTIYFYLRIYQQIQSDISSFRTKSCAFSRNGPDTGAPWLIARPISERHGTAWQPADPSARPYHRTARAPDLFPPTHRQTGKTSPTPETVAHVTGSPQAAHHQQTTEENHPEPADTAGRDARRTASLSHSRRRPPTLSAHKGRQGGR